MSDLYSRRGRGGLRAAHRRAAVRRLHAHRHPLDVERAPRPILEPRPTVRPRSRWPTFTACGRRIPAARWPADYRRATRRRSAARGASASLGAKKKKKRRRNQAVYLAPLTSPPPQSRGHGKLQAPYRSVGGDLHHAGAGGLRGGRRSPSSPSSAASMAPGSRRGPSNGPRTIPPCSAWTTARRSPPRSLPGRPWSRPRART